MYGKLILQINLFITSIQRRHGTETVTGNPAEENSSIFSLIRMSSAMACRQ